MGFKAHPFSNLLHFCDSFALAKMLIKTTCLSKDYDVSLAPNDGGVTNEVEIEISNLNEKVDQKRVLA